MTIGLNNLHTDYTKSTVKRTFSIAAYSCTGANCQGVDSSSLACLCYLRRVGTRKCCSSVAEAGIGLITEACVRCHVHAIVVVHMTDRQTDDRIMPIGDHAV